MWHLRGKRHVVDLGVNGRIILILLFKEQEWGVLGCTDLTEDRESGGLL
jgi:hypothetical protein